MQSTYRLKRPIFITVRRGANTRVEAIASVTFKTLAPGKVQELRGGAEGFCDIIDDRDWDDPIDLACELAELDIEEGLRTAYEIALHHADNFLYSLAKAEAQAAAGTGGPPALKPGERFIHQCEADHAEVRARRERSDDLFLAMRAAS